MPAFEDEHRHFLQGMLKNPILAENDAVELAKKCCSVLDKESLVKADFKAFLDIVNRKIQGLDLRISEIDSEIDGIKYWCLVNLSADEGAKAASSLQKHEIEYFNKLIESIIENDGVIEDAAREKIGASLESKKVSISEGQMVVQKLQEERWLGKLSSGKTVLGSRSLIELGSQLKAKLESTGEMSSVLCHICNKLCVLGQRCVGSDAGDDGAGSAGCGVKCHMPCLRKYWVKTKSDEICVKCKAPWPHEVELYPHLFISNDDSEDEGHSGNGKGVGEEKEDEEEIGRSTKRGRRSGGSKAASHRQSRGSVRRK